MSTPVIVECVHLNDSHSDLNFCRKKAGVLRFLFVWSFSVSQADGILLDLGKTLEGPGVCPVIPNS